MSVTTQIDAGRASLGIELGSTRIKACLIDADHPTEVLGTGSFAWENQLVGGLWSYDLDDVRRGVQAAYRDLCEQVEATHHTSIRQLAGLGVSAMMHGYLAFDDAGTLLVPFRTWRNTNTTEAAAQLTRALHLNIPLRWSIAHLMQACLDREAHVPQVAHVTTLAGYVHWMLSGERVLGVGDASGMFPIAADGSGYDAARLNKAQEIISPLAPALRIGEVLPEPLRAGADAGNLTSEGAAWLDPSGALQSGVPMCPPEGDAGTGMVATNSVAPRTGNVSAGTSIFAMVVLEHELKEIHEEIDLVTTPAGDAVAMVHCNNGASELETWVKLFADFGQRMGGSHAIDDVFRVLLEAADQHPVTSPGVLSYNHLAAEPVVDVPSGRPLVMRTPESSLTLDSLMRSQLNGVFASLAVGMQTLASEHVQVDQMYAHGGIFRTAGVAQRALAAAIDAPVAVGEAASEGGAWGIAVLANFRQQHDRGPLHEYLQRVVFADAEVTSVTPSNDDVAAYATYLTHYQAGLAAERAAANAV